jgi:hypothetical protein
MATWNDVVSYLKANYNCKQEIPELVSLVFKTGDNRSQLVFVELGGNDKVGQFAHVSSAVGNVKDRNKLEAYCLAAKDYILGGIVIDGDFIMLRDSFPLLNLDVNEMEAPLQVILAAADQIESKITGGDNY